MNDMLSPNKMIEATRLTRAGRLTEATALLQRMLRAERPPDMTIGTAGDIVPTGREPPIIDATAKSEETDRPPSSRVRINSRPAGRPFANAATTAQPHMFRSLSALLRGGRLGSGLGLHGLVQPAPVSTPDIVPDGGKFIEATYSNPAGTRAYKLYVPSGYHGQALSLRRRRLRTCKRKYIAVGFPADMHIPAQSIPTRAGGQSLSTGRSMAPDTPGREAAPLAPTPTREGRTPRGRCCASSSSTQADSRSVVLLLCPTWLLTGEINREFCRFRPSVQSASKLCGLAAKFSTQWNREFFGVNREFSAKNREFSRPNREFKFRSCFGPHLGR